MSTWYTLEITNFDNLEIKINKFLYFSLIRYG